MQYYRRTARLAALASGLLMTMACAAHAAPASAPATPTAAPATPDARGRAVLKAQLAALDDKQAFAATFAANATVLSPSGANEVHESDSHATSAISGLNPHAEIRSATFDHFTSGSVGQVAWFAADLHVTIESHEPESPASTSTRTVHAIELLDGANGWKVTVAAFTRVGPMNPDGACNIRDATEIGPLTKLLLSPTAISGALGEGAIVYGTEPAERGLGTKDAKALLAKWKNLTITLDTPAEVHEVRGKTYGYTMANIYIATKHGSPPYRLNAFLLALPAADGTWSVIGTSFGAL